LESITQLTVGALIFLVVSQLLILLAVYSTQRNHLSFYVVSIALLMQVALLMRVLDSEEETNFRHLGSGTLLFEGEITRSSYDSLQAWLAKNEIEQIYVSSPGGNIITALAIRETILGLSQNEPNFKVHINNECNSACIPAFLGPWIVTSEVDTIFGFHRAADQNGTPVPLEQDLIIQHIIAQAYPQELIEATKKTHPSSLHKVSASAMETFGLVTKVLDTKAKKSE
jgi:hypothetical protein